VRSLSRTVDRLSGDCQNQAEALAAHQQLLPQVLSATSPRASPMSHTPATPAVVVISQAAPEHTTAPAAMAADPIHLPVPTPAMVQRMGTDLPDSPDSPDQLRARSRSPPRSPLVGRGRAAAAGDADVSMRDTADGTTDAQISTPRRGGGSRSLKHSIPHSHLIKGCQ
jgi:hypothetical protein